ncbi:DUF4097 family beta strand repeat-containing protein [Amycolatopsis oliviviridis]|uniref:Adhesin domain-containing protein n=1 Tax=Amycolatopsis oliviviridis TaxID=1471590 RepID=A0ABQ3LBV6_9PSEU|nr:hypothetical protein [Amycolatopsis oliviviridis]GHH01394.1 hypothetical protein GCM10017790_01300 [Amycolatopsis oliviviridis]
MQKFDTPAPISAFVEIVAGRIKFVAAERADTAVEVLPADASKSDDVKVAEQTKVEYGDGVLRILWRTTQLLGGSGSGSVDVTVQLPVGSRVDAQAASTEFRTVGRLGDVKFEGVQAPITIDEAASVHVTVVDGDVEVGRLSGSAEISTVQGNIRIGEAVRGKVVLRALTGDISVSAAAGVAASLDAGGGGRVKNSLRNDGTAAELDIHATTTEGNITAGSR